MSLQQPAPEDELEEKGLFFIEPGKEHDWNREDNDDHYTIILQKADALASENRLKEAIEVFTMALRYGSVRPGHLNTLVDCILRNFKKKIEENEIISERRKDGPDSTGGIFDCPSCHRFLGEPVTIGCGHSYCKRCLQNDLLAKCKLCSETIRGRPGSVKINVILSGLLDKWFPNDLRRSKAINEIEDLCRRKDLEKAASLATKVIQDDPGDVVARWLRAEAYSGLKQYSLALEDTDICLEASISAQGYYHKAQVLQQMGQVDESLQVFLHCLALDEEFPRAKREVELILCNLLSPGGENVKVGLRETALNTSPHLRSKRPVADAQSQHQTLPPVQHQSNPHTHQARATSAHSSCDAQEKPGRSESLERSGLSRAHSLRCHGPGSGVEGLKRVCSAPQLGDQEKGALLKRKLSSSDSTTWVTSHGGSKHKKQVAGIVPGHPFAAATHRSPRTIPLDLLDTNDLECSLCMRLFYEPVSTPCGHTFCKNCLERCLDHTPQCPLCKESLKEYLATRKYNVTSVLDELIKQYLSEEHAERQRIHLEETRELSDLTKNVPIFVCTMAYPTVPCPLHVFEPRYRLMIRRCMDTGTRQFGMCINDAQKGFVDCGCMLIIRSVHFLPDGRSVVDTIGGKRFRVLSRSMKDGYSIADIQYLEDTKVEDAEELSKLQELHDAVYEQARSWFQNLKNRFRNQILQHFGPMPEREPDIQATPNGPACCWWLLAVLPIDPRYQLSVLSMTTLRERLVKIQHILTYLQSIPNE